jgi:carboxyl-terminal processing protease
VLTAALRDNGRAVVWGEPTFGKGIVQTVVSIRGSTGVAVTTSAYLTPSGSSINKVPILNHYLDTPRSSSMAFA